MYMITKEDRGLRPQVQAEPLTDMGNSGPSDLAETRISTVLGMKQFMQGPIRTLLVKGLAGTGKTTVALEILKAAGKGKGAYISSRVPKELLEMQIPAMQKTLQNQEFYDIRLEDATTALDFVIQLTGPRKSKPLCLIVGMASQRNWTRRKGYEPRRL